MNKTDEFWFWTFRAIMNPKGSNRFYYYDKFNDELFGLLIKPEEILPLYRNSYTGTKDENSIKFLKRIQDIEKKNLNIILLPALTLKEKREFLIQFINKMVDEKLKLALLTDAQNLRDSDEFNFKTEIAEINKSVAMEFDMQRGEFLATKVKENYFPLGISENTFVLW